MNEDKTDAILAGEAATDAAAWREIERKRHRHRPNALHVVALPPDGVARNYGQLVAMLAQARHDARIAQERLDDICGFQDGYTGKLERPDRDAGRSAVNLTFDMWLAGLKVGIKLVPLP